MIYFYPDRPEIVGYIPQWLSESDPRRARAQLDEHYKHGGGWRAFPGFTLNADNSLSYPGDPPLRALTSATFREEFIVMYRHAWVAIIQSDRSFEVCRMD